MFIHIHICIQLFIGCWEVNLVKTSGFCYPITNCVPCYSHNFPVPLHPSPVSGGNNYSPRLVRCFFFASVSRPAFKWIFRLLARYSVALFFVVLSSSCFVFLSSCCRVTRWLGDVSLVGNSPSGRDSCVTVVSMYYMCAYC